MRGTDKRSGELSSYVDLEQRVRADHPLRAIRTVVSAALDALSGEFAALYSGMGRPSIAPEMLLRAMLLQAFYSVRSERQLMERLEYDLLFRWFFGLGVDEPVWDHSTFSKNRDRLLDGDVAARFLSEILAQPRVRQLLSRDHFSVDGTLVEAWASMKSFSEEGVREAAGAKISPWIKSETLKPILKRDGPTVHPLRLRLHRLIEAMDRSVRRWPSYQTRRKPFAICRGERGSSNDACIRAIEVQSSEHIWSYKLVCDRR
jgi:transposase